MLNEMAHAAVYERFKIQAHFLVCEMYRYPKIEGLLTVFMMIERETFYNKKGKWHAKFKSQCVHKCIIKK